MNEQVTVIEPNRTPTLAEDSRLTKMEPQAMQPAALPHDISTDPMMMVARAVAAGASMEIIRELIAMRDRYAAEAKKDAFDEAMVKVKAELKPVIKNKHVAFPSKQQGSKGTDYWHEDLSAVCEAIDAVAPKHGIAYRWNTITEMGKPVVAQCIVSGHGHVFVVEQSGGRDDSGNKNALQSQSSALTYLKRDTLKSAFGLASKDDDARTAGGDQDEYITEEQVKFLTKLIEDTGGDVDKFVKFAKVERLQDIFASRYEAAVAAVNRAAAERKAKQS